MANFTEWLNAERWDLIRDYLLGRRRTVAWVDQGDADEINDTQLIETCKRASLPEDILTLILSKVDLNRAFPSRTFLANGLERKETALHAAAEEGSETTLKVLLETLGPQRRREEIFREDMEGKTVMDRLWTSFVTQHMSQLEDVTSFQKLMYNSIVMQLWNKTTLLLLAARPSRLNHVLLDGTQFNSVHAILSHREGGGGDPSSSVATNSSSASSCPSVLLYLALKLYPHQPKHPNEYGFYPLHLSILNPTHYALHPSLLPANSPSTHTSLLHDANIIPPIQLLSLYPEAASIPHPTTGQYPLHLALESYHLYHTLHQSRFDARGGEVPTHSSWMYNHHHHHYVNNSSLITASVSSTSSSINILDIPQHHQPTPWDNLVLELISLYPAALSIPDKQQQQQQQQSNNHDNENSAANTTNNINNNKNLLPFFMAASIPSINLTTLFTILRSNPTILKNVIKTTRQERYLTQKVLKLKRERDGMESLIMELQTKVAKLEQQVVVNPRRRREETTKKEGGKEEEKEGEKIASLDAVKSNEENGESATTTIVSSTSATVCKSKTNNNDNNSADKNTK